MQRCGKGNRATAFSGLSCGIKGRSLFRYPIMSAANLDRIIHPVIAAKELGLPVRFTCEDASRPTSTG